MATSSEEAYRRVLEPRAASLCRPGGSSPSKYERIKHQDCFEGSGLFRFRR